MNIISQMETIWPGWTVEERIGAGSYGQVYRVSRTVGNRKYYSAVKVITIPQSETSFNIAKEGLTKQLASRRTTKFALINAWITARDLGLDYDLNKNVYEALPNLTMKDIVDFEQQQIARKPYRYIILGDERELDMAALQQYGPIRRVTLSEIFGY